MSPEETLDTLTPFAGAVLLDLAKGKDLGLLDSMEIDAMTRPGIIRLTPDYQFELSPHGRRVMHLLKLRRGL